MVVVLGDDLLQLLYAVLLELRRGVIGHVSQKRGAVQRSIAGTFTYTTNELVDNGGSGAIKAGVYAPTVKDIL